ncbi:MAG: hypothetical protein ACRD5L_09815 [Bryobacteraceae bacterium]
MKKFATISMLFAALAAAQGTESIEVRGKRIVDEAVAALGGQKFLTMQNRIESGRAYSFFHDQLSGLSVAKIYTQYTPAAAGKTGVDLGVLERQGFGKNEDSYVLFNGEGAWEVTFRGPKALDKDRIRRYYDSTMSNVFYILRQRLHEPGLILESRGTDVIENADVELVDITDSQNRVITVAFHHSTKLPVRQTWVWRDPETKERNEEITRFSRYRTVDGIQWPYQIDRERNGEKVYDIFSESVSINQDFPEDLFANPIGPATKPSLKPEQKK